MKKTALFAMIILLSLSFYSAQAQSTTQRPSKGLKNLSTCKKAYDSLAAAYDSLEKITEYNFSELQTEKGLHSQATEKLIEANTNVNNLLVSTGKHIGEINRLNSEKTVLINELQELRLKKDSAGFKTTTAEISDLVQDSTVVALVKNMELGLKFYEMNADELAARYSGLSVNWRREAKNKFIVGKSFVDVSSDALQGEILKWMKYRYDNSKTAERLRLSNLFYNITGDTHFQKKY